MQQVAQIRPAGGALTKEDIPAVNGIEGTYQRFIGANVLVFAGVSALSFVVLNGALLWWATGTSRIWWLALLSAPVSLAGSSLLFRAYTRFILPPETCSTQYRTAPQQGRTPFPTPTRSISPSASLFTTVRATLSSRPALDLLVGYIIAALVALVTYSTVMVIYSEDAKLGLFASTPRHVLHLNENAVFLLIGTTTFASILALSRALGERGIGAWQNHESTLYTNVGWTLVSSLRWIVPVSEENFEFGVMVRKLVPYTLVRYVLPWVYAFSSKRVYRTILQMPFSFMIRPFIVNFTRPSHRLSPHIGSHLGNVLLMVLIATELPISTLAVYFTTRVKLDRLVDSSPVESDQWFSDALQTKNEFLQHHILSALRAHLSAPNTLSRLFSQIPPSRPAQPAVLNIWEQLLIQIGRRHALLLSLKPQAASASAPKPAASSAPSASSIPAAAIRRDVNVLKPPVPVRPTTALGQASAWFTGVLAGGPPVIAAPPAVAVVEQFVAEKGKVVVQSSQEVVKRSGAADWVGKKVFGTYWPRARNEGLRERKAVQVAYGGVKAFWGRQWGRRQVEVGLRGREVLKGIFDAFVIITETSVTQDTYGYVQTVIPGTIECINRYHAEVQSFQAGILAQSAVLGNGKVGQAARDFVAMETNAVLKECESAIYRLASAYGASFKAFKFPTGVAADVQAIVDRQRPAGK